MTSTSIPCEETPQFVTYTKGLLSFSVQDVTDYGIALIMMSAFSFVPAGMIVYLVAERAGEERRVQAVTGVSTAVYWSAAILWDAAVSLLIVLLTAAILLAFSVDSFASEGNFWASVALVASFCLASSAIARSIERVFRDPSMAQLAVLTGGMLAGLAALLLVLLLEAMYDNQV